MTDDRRNDSNDDAANAAGDDAHVGGDVTDARFDAWLQSAARDYNRPGETVPRDDMWGAIERALPPVAIPLRPVRRTAIWWQAAAALLLLAGGIAIGRQWSASGSTAPSMAQQEPQGARSTAGSDAPAVVPVSPSSQLALGESASTARATAPLVDGAAVATRRAAPAGRGSNESYDVATMEHLSRAEALLTSFRTPRSAGDGTPMNRWARDLLADTRLLLDSPAASDARRRQLLEDLELVLAQIVQLPAEASADRGLVQRSIERGAVLSRLRSSIPAGFASGT